MDLLHWKSNLYQCSENFTVSSESALKVGAANLLITPSANNFVENFSNKEIDWARKVQNITILTLNFKFNNIKYKSQFNFYSCLLTKALFDPYLVY